LSGANGWNGCVAASHFVRLSTLRTSVGARFHLASFGIKVAQIMFRDGGLPDLLLDVSDPTGLAGAAGREVNFASADADAPAAGDADSAIVERVVWRGWRPAG